MMTHRFASMADANLLGTLNWQLIQDEGHANPMSVGELTERMAGWLGANYQAVLFLEGDALAAYALYRVEPDHIYLRQFFVQRHLRRTGVGRQCVKCLFTEVWPPVRVVVEVLTGNPSGVAFWRAVGFVDYSLTLEAR